MKEKKLNKNSIFELPVHDSDFKEIKILQDDNGCTNLIRLDTHQALLLKQEFIAMAMIQILVPVLPNILNLRHPEEIVGCI